MQRVARIAFGAVMLFCAFMYFLVEPAAYNAEQLESLRSVSTLLIFLVGLCVAVLMTIAVLEPVSESETLHQVTLLPTLSSILALIWWLMLGVSGHWPLFFTLFAALPVGYVMGAKRNVSRRKLRSEYLRGKK